MVRETYIDGVTISPYSMVSQLKRGKEVHPLQKYKYLSICEILTKV